MKSDVLLIGIGIALVVLVLVSVGLYYFGQRSCPQQQVGLPMTRPIPRVSAPAAAPAPVAPENPAKDIGQE